MWFIYSGAKAIIKNWTGGQTSVGIGSVQTGSTSWVDHGSTALKTLESLLKTFRKITYKLAEFSYFPNTLVWQILKGFVATVIWPLPFKKKKKRGYIAAAILSLSLSKQKNSPSHTHMETVVPTGLALVIFNIDYGNKLRGWEVRGVLMASK